MLEFYRGMQRTMSFYLCVNYYIPVHKVLVYKVHLWYWGHVQLHSPSHRLLRLLRPFFTNVLATKLVWERLLLLLSNTAILTSSERHLLTRYMVAPAATSLLVRTEQERAFQPLLKCSHSLLRSITRILQWTAARWAGSVILFLIITVCYIGQWY